MEVDIQALEEAVLVFYRSGTSEQATAHQWLLQLQSSPQAWSFSWELMQIGKQTQVQFFGATTLHAKLMKHWHEVPKENYDELKQKLFEKIIAFGSGPKIVLNRLCVALSAFIVHMLKEGTTAIDEIINIFENQQLPNLTRNTQIWIMMEVLCHIPEEANIMHTSIHKASIRNEMCKSTGFVLNTIDQYISMKCNSDLKNEDMVTITKAAKCAGVWFKNCGYPLDNCHNIVSTLLKLINKCYWNYQKEGCMPANENEITETCLETLLLLMVQPDAHRYSNTALLFLKMFLDNLSNITKAEWMENNLNEDLAVGIYTLFISSIECHSSLLINGLSSENEEYKDIHMRLIEKVIECTDKPGIYPVEESCSNLAMGFWYMLQDEVLAVENAENKHKCLAIITPLYEYLTKILIRKAQLPNESIESIECWTTEDFETFRCYRQDIADTLKYCYDVLHENILNILAQTLNDAVAIVQNDITKWPILEASIYVFHAIADHVSTEKSKPIIQLMTILHDIPFEKLHEKLLGTTLETIGGFSEWLKHNPEYLPSAINLLVKGLNSSMASQATLGLKDLTRECQMEMKTYAEPILEACQQTLLTGNLKHVQSVRLMYSIGRLMSMLPQERIPVFLDSIVSPLFEELQIIVQNRVTNESMKIRTTFRLNMITTLFSQLYVKYETDENGELGEYNSTQQSKIQPLQIVMEKTMPLMRQIGELWIHENTIIEALCSSLKYALVNLLNDFKPMIPDLCSLIIAILQTKSFAPAGDLAKTCIIMFYNENDLKTTMQQLFIEITLYNFRMFEQTPENNFSEIADVLETFFNLNVHMVKKLPIIYSDTNIDCYKLIIYALKAITLPENEPVKFGVQFLSHFIVQSRKFINMRTVVLDKGEDIVRTILFCIGTLSRRTQIDSFADIFMALNKNYSTEFIFWMKILETPNFPTNLINNNDKELFMKTIIKERVNKKSVQSNIRQFAEKTRGLSLN